MESTPFNVIDYRTLLVMGGVLGLTKRFIDLDEHHAEDRSDLTEIMWTLRDEYAVAWSSEAEDLVESVGDLLAWLAEGVCISESVTRSA